MLKKAFAVAITAILALVITACNYFAIDDNDNDRKFDVPAESISLSDTYIEMHPGETAAVKASVYPTYTEDKTTFRSDNINIVTINENGEITAKGIGEATIYAEAGFLSASCRVKVQAPPAVSISVNTNVLDLKINETFKLETEVLPQNADYTELEFFSDDERIATVDKDGLITAVGVGYTSVGIYIPESPRIRCVVEINTYADSITDMRFDKNCCAVLKDSTSALELNIKPFGMSQDMIVFESSDETIAKVDANGIVKGIEYGTAVIKATAPDGITAECSVVVTKRLAPDPAANTGSPSYIRDNGVYTQTVNSEDNTATVMLAGAVYADAQRQNDARTDAGFDFTESFVYLKRHLQSCNLAIAELESTLSYSEAYGCEGGEEYNSPSSLLGALRYAGFDALATAGIAEECSNGQIMLETAEQIEKYGFMNSGAQTFLSEQKGIIAQTGGINIGILSYDTTTSDSPYAYSEKTAENDIASLKERGAEFIIVYLESRGVKDKKLKGIFAELAYIGADISVGVDPEKLKGAEYIETNNDNRMLAAYSLGSLSADSKGKTGNDAAMIKIKLQKQNGNVVITQAGYIPIRLIGSYEGNSYVSVPTHTDDSNISLILSAERINTILGDTLPEINDQDIQ